uniref:Photosystem I assembly protein Ycf4 n=2 Tax=Dunaliella TaxID=3044 RepID=K7NVK7_DUNTE|nr:photosystem I assembly protein Ycf4 [Dunaliella tertiolecta]AOH77181.1 photosystem I assembly protein Ycf4 [Dunaliella salina]
MKEKNMTKNEQKTSLETSVPTGTQNKLPIKAARNLIRRYIIIGERRISNYWWAFIVLLGSSGFLLSGICSYNYNAGNSSGILFNLLSFLDFKDIAFFPQGLLMSFYGGLGFLLSFYWWFLIFWNVGGGFNEFNKKEGFIRIFRWGYPGKNRRIDFTYPLKDLEAIKVELKQGLDPQRTIFLKLKGKKEIPITGIGEPLTLKEIEKQASELANFLDVSILT